MAVQLPFAVTDQDYWVSLPLDGLTPALLKLGVRQHTGQWLNQKGIGACMQVVQRERGRTCQYCTKRKVSRYFLILKPTEEARLTGFVVCTTCADQLKADVAQTP